MKKITILLLVIFTATSTAMAQEGLYAGAEFGIEDFSAAGETVSATPYAGYEIEIFDSLELAAELRFPMVFDPEFAFDIELEPSVTYSIDPLYFGVAGPMLLFSSADGVDPFDWIELNFTVGAEFESGFGIEATLYNSLRPSSWADSLDIYPFYTMDPLFFALCIGIPLYEDGIKAEGLTITPEVGFDITENFNIYALFPIGGIASDEDIGVGLTVGVKYSF